MQCVTRWKNINKSADRSAAAAAAAAAERVSPDKMRLKEHISIQLLAVLSLSLFPLTRPCPGMGSAPCRVGQQWVQLCERGPMAPGP